MGRRRFTPGRTVSVFTALLLLPAGLARATPEGPRPPADALDRSGLSELVFWQGINGLIAGSFLSAAITGGQVHAHCGTTYGPQNESSEACDDALARGAGIGVLSLAAGVAVPLLVTRGRSIRTGDTILINRSTLIGAMHGYIIPFAAGLEPFEPDMLEYAVDIDEARALAALTVVGDVAGIGVGTYLASKYEVTPGTISFLGTLHSATFLAAFSVGSSFPEEVNQDDTRLISALSLGLADLALGVGLLYRDRIDIGRNRVFWLDTGAVVGWLAGGGLAAAIAGNEERAASIGGTLGMAAGIVLSYWATSDSEPWRQRHEGMPAVTFDGPSVRMEPVSHPQGGLRYSIDLFRGRF